MFNSSLSKMNCFVYLCVYSTCLIVHDFILLQNSFSWHHDVISSKFIRRKNKRLIDTEYQQFFRLRLEMEKKNNFSEVLMEVFKLFSTLSLPWQHSQNVKKSISHFEGTRGVERRKKLKLFRISHSFLYWNFKIIIVIEIVAEEVEHNRGIPESSIQYSPVLL